MTTKLADRELARALARRDPNAFLPFARLLVDYVQELNHKAGVPEEVAAVLQASVVQSGFPVLLRVQAGDDAHAAGVLRQIWAGQMRALGMDPGDLGAGDAVERTPPGPAGEPSSLSDSYAMFVWAIANQQRDQHARARGRSAIQRLMVRLDLSFDDVGRMMGVSGETVRRWQRGTVNIPSGHLATLDLDDSALSRLEQLFEADRIASVIRRPAELFGGKRALDEILQGHLPEVTERYDAALQYQM